MNKRTTVVNLFAGPGAGKSTFCAGLFATMKWLGVNCEMALEYAKDLVWQGSTDVLDNQLYVFGKQQKRLFRLNKKVDIVITDAPLINSIVYLDDRRGPLARATLTEVVMSEHRSYDNLNFFIERRKKYSPNGRLHSEEDAVKVDNLIQQILRGHAEPYTLIPGLPSNVATIVKMILSHRPDIKLEQTTDVQSDNLFQKVLETPQV